MSDGLRINAPASPNILGGLQQGFQIRKQRADLKEHAAGAPLREQQRQQQQLSSSDEAKFKSVFQGALQLKGITSNQGKLEFLNQRKKDLQAAGIGTQDTDGAIALAQQGRFDELGNITDLAISKGNQFFGNRTVRSTSRLPGGITVSTLSDGATEVRNAANEIIKGQAAIEAVEAAEQREIELATQKETGKSKVKLATEESMSEILALRKRGQDLTKVQDAQLQGFVEVGVSAYERLPQVNRGIDLLDRVRTGGLTARSKVITDFFGTTSGDVAELNKILAGNVLTGLSVFTGAISEGERAFLERMETNLASGGEFNRREMLRMQNMLKTQINIAKEAAKETGNKFAERLLSGEFDEEEQQQPTTGEFTSPSGVSFTVK